MASHATDAIRALETEISPRLAEHRDAIHMNRALFERIRQVAAADEDEAWLLERYRLDFVRAGAFDSSSTASSCTCTCTNTSGTATAILFSGTSAGARTNTILDDGADNAEDGADDDAR